MKAERWIFYGLGVYFVAVCAIYAYVTREVVGIVALALAAVMCFIPAGYFQVIHGKLGKRPEDDQDGEIAQGAGDLGFFPPHSTWPFWVALSILSLIHI